MVALHGREGPLMLLQVEGATLEEIQEALSLLDGCTAKFPNGVRV